jgi:hypothetical protein
MLSESKPEPHPTREDWESRRALWPEGMRKVFEQHESVLAAEHAAQLALEEKAAQELRERMEGFEKALATILTGNEWLQEYRCQNPPELATPFQHCHRAWYAVYDLTPVGGWRLVIEIPLLAAYHFGHLEWAPLHTKFTVKYPSHSFTTNDFACAVYRMVQWCPTPF